MTGQDIEYRRYGPFTHHQGGREFVSEKQYWIDGRPASRLDPAVRAVQYGDGLFETICVRNGVIEYLDRHRQRLQAGCGKLQLTFNDWTALDSELQRYADALGSGVIKIIFSRGAGSRGYRFRADQGVTRIITTDPLPACPPEHGTYGVQVRLCDLRLGRQPRLAGIKHLNRLEQVMARAEWGRQYQEGLLFDCDNRLIEGTMSNLFVVHDHRVSTPRLDNCGVAGIMRSVLLDLAVESGFQTERRVLGREALESAQEVFLCNSLIGIWPVIAVAGGPGYAVGPVTQALQRALAGYSKTGPGEWYAW